MKKNKKLQYILLTVVLVVWGLVIYRIFFEGRSKPDNLTQVIKPIVKETIEAKKESYRLIASYRDPFLEGGTSIEIKPENADQENQQRSSSNLRRRRTNVSRVRWPEVKYGGFIESNGNKYTILLNIKNRDYLVYEGDTVEEIVVKEFYKDSLIVSYNNEDKTLIK